VLERERRLQELVERALVNKVSEAGTERRAREAHDEAQEQFTFREKEILRLLARGLTNAQIARAVHLSTGTVKNYVARILPRLNAIDRTQAAVRAIELGLVSSEDAPSTA
jgi:DNA-binding NarL/FixJ family response regulator